MSLHVLQSVFIAWHPNHNHTSLCFSEHVFQHCPHNENVITYLLNTWRLLLFTLLISADTEWKAHRQGVSGIINGSSPETTSLHSFLCCSYCSNQKVLRDLIAHTEKYM